jgi:hypothetical protein
MQVVATVLQLVVQHATVHLRDICTWLRLSKVIRRTLQQSVGGLAVRCYSWESSVELLTAIARWLPCHAGLVSTLVLQCRYGARSEKSKWSAAEQMLTLALQLSSVSRTHSTHPDASRHPVLQLKCFETDFVLQPAALRSLAASDHLTQLELKRVPPKRLTAELCSALSSALSSLRGLRQLLIELASDPPAPYHSQSFPVKLAAALADMTQLTQLSAIGLVPAATLGHLPASLECFATGHRPHSRTGSSRLPTCLLEPTYQAAVAVPDST